MKLLYIESMCTDESIVEANIWNSKVGLPDFVGLTPADAFRDFKARIRHYEAVYEPMDEEDLSWIKLINVARGAFRRGRFLPAVRPFRCAFLISRLIADLSRLPSVGSAASGWRSTTSTASCWAASCSARARASRGQLPILCPEALTKLAPYTDPTPQVPGQHAQHRAQHISVPPRAVGGARAAELRACGCPA